MTKAQAIKKLKELQEIDDTEAAHCEADDVLVKLLISLGHGEVADEFERIGKWYA
ncbi:hypothetical protein [Serratia fonticola]